MNHPPRATPCSQRRTALPSLLGLLAASALVAAPLPPAPRATGYLARGGGLISLVESPEAKRPVAVLPPLPLVYNPQPLVSGLAAVPLVEAAAAPSMRAESHTFTLPAVLPPIPGAGAMGPAIPGGAFSPQPSTLSPLAVIRMFQTQVGGDRNTTGILLNDVPSLYQTPTHRGSSAAYELKR